MPRIAPRRAVRLLVLPLALLLLAAPPAAAQKTMKAISEQQMTKILESSGFSVEKAGDNALMFELNGMRVLMLLLNDNSDGQLYLGTTAASLSLKQINEWNRSKRFGRAYIDDDGDPVLESDLDFEAGVTEEQVKAWVRIYRSLADEFMLLLRANAEE